MSIDRGPGPGVSSRLGYLLKHVGMRMEQLNTAALSPLGIDARELGVLLVLDGHEPASQQQTAQRLGVDRTTMVAVLDALEEKGLTARAPQAEDRRRNVVALTRAGEATLRRARQASDEAERALLAPLGPQDGERLREALTRIVTGPDTRAE